MQDYGELRGQFLDMFPTAHPCYEAYQKGLEAVRLIEDLGATVYLAHSRVGFLLLFFYVLFFSYTFIIPIRAALPGSGYSSRKSSATQSYKCMLFFVFPLVFLRKVCGLIYKLSGL